ncbi:hypothetical protein EOK75_08905 [Pseudorhodobacter turbinis]|uniref:Mitochondrial inner membrane protein n=1 Tax=Pseudorhodobacter turbinis TaxID=2500533 RepID=A0A4P8EFI3_9RHOB|nr:mitofilin family membrane protein [Pseudorhodobacter turbinis]QCO55850.1 hypothetical protein EOK75_08905 [Pseudorhodobacter turbinis]
MATPKTPRKRAVKAQVAQDGSAGEPLVDATTETPPSVSDVSEPAKVEDSAVAQDGAADTTSPAPTEETVDVAEQPVEPETPEEKPEIAKEVEVAAPPPPVVKSGPGFVPLVLGGVVAAGIGFGLAQYIKPEGWPFPGTSTMQADYEQQAKDIADLRAQIAALPKEDASTALMGEVEQIRDIANTALETAQAATPAPQTDVTPQLETLAARITALENRVPEGETVEPAAIQALKADIATLRSGLDEQKAAAQEIIDAAEVTRANAVAEAQTVLLQAAVSNVEAAMQNGLPFAEPLATLADAGITIPQTLTDHAENGVPTITALTESFDVAARAALNQSLRENMGSTWTERAGSFLRSQTGARSLTPQQGDDPDAVLSRANAAVAAGDLQTALTEIEALPPVAQDALGDWVAQAKLRQDAQAATAELTAALSER